MLLIEIYFIFFEIYRVCYVYVQNLFMFSYVVW